MINYVIRAVCLAFFCFSSLNAMTENPKREFRGAWMHTIGQGQYRKQSTEENQTYLRNQLDLLKDAGINVVLFQVRPSADAFYESQYELWSKYLTSGGKAPNPYWDPLKFMIDEAHSRGMELHAWLNPYRVTTSKGEQLPKEHLYHSEPWRFVVYEGDGKMYFDPALHENREYIAKVVLDIVDNYDVDGIHFDDYFYPYPANKKDFPDDNSYNKYGNGQNRGDWRRQNVDKLIELVHSTVKSSSRPWVRFGISPFGIWRNKKSDPRGSDTNGLANYDDLYADVLLWAQKGWIDYLIPQLYWELEHPRASSLILVDWWANAVDDACQLYIGQDVEKTMSKSDIEPSCDSNQLAHKIALTRDNDKVHGNCWWPAYSITKNFMGVADELSEDKQSTYALVPEYPEISDKKPMMVKNVRIEGSQLVWKAPEQTGVPHDAVKFVVYCFPEGEAMDFDDASFIEAITSDNSIEISEPGRYVVTSLSRTNIESEPTKAVRLK